MNPPLVGSHWYPGAQMMGLCLSIPSTGIWSSVLATKDHPPMTMRWDLLSLVLLCSPLINVELALEVSVLASIRWRCNRRTARQIARSRLGQLLARLHLGAWGFGFVTSLGLRIRGLVLGVPLTVRVR